MIKIKIKRENHCKDSATTIEWGKFLQIYLIGIVKDRIWIPLRDLKSDELH